MWGCWLVPRGWPGASGGALGPSGAPGQAGETQGPAARGRAGVPPREALPAGCLSSSWLGAVLQLEWLRMEGEGYGSPPRGRIGPWGARDPPLYPLPGPCLFVLLPVIEQSVATQEHGHGPAVHPLQELGVRIQPRTPPGGPDWVLPAPGSPAAIPAHPVPSSPARLRRLPASPAGPSSSIPARRTASGKRGVAAGPGIPNPGCPAPWGRDWQGTRAGVQQGRKRDRSGGRGMRVPQGSGALGNTAVSLAPQRPELAWGRRCPQPRARKVAQRAIEGLSGPAQSPLLTPVAPPTPALAGGGQQDSDLGAERRMRPRAVWHGRPAICPRRRQCQPLPCAGPGPAREGAFAPGRSPLLPSAAFSPPAFCCLHLSHRGGKRLTPSSPGR